MDINDHLKSLRRLQEKMSRIYSPAIQRQFDIIRNSGVLDSMRIAQETIPPTLNAAIESQRRLFEIAFQPPSEELLKMSESFMRANLAMSDSMRIWQQTATKLSHLSSLHIPDNFYPSLAELSSALLDVLPKEEHSDLPASITVAQPRERTEPQPITWGQLQSFLYFVLTIIASFYIANESTIQSETQHKEHMIEIHKQTELLEKSVEIEQQRLEIEKERLIIDKEHLEREKRLEEKFSSFMEIIEPLIPEDPNVPEE